jgi:CRP-like cAMP-binding protein
VVALESIALFRNLSPDEFSLLRFITQEHPLAAGHEIFREGDAGNGLYFVKDGLVEISGLVGGNTRRVFSELGPGEIFGEMAVIEQRPRSATATTLKESVVYFIPRDEMLSLIQRVPALAFGLLQQISHRLREFNQLHLREVVQAERLAVIGNFARGIVHDLKNPLSIIGLSAEMFDMPGVSPEIRARRRRA